MRCAQRRRWRPRALHTNVRENAASRLAASHACAPLLLRLRTFPPFIRTVVQCSTVQYGSLNANETALAELGLASVSPRPVSASERQSRRREVGLSIDTAVERGDGSARRSAHCPLPTASPLHTALVPTAHHPLARTTPCSTDSPPQHKPRPSRHVASILARHSSRHSPPPLRTTHHTSSAPPTHPSLTSFNS